MEHSCQQCGHEVEEGRPFCPQCRAPQIHVRPAIPDDVLLHPAPEESLAETVHAGYFDRSDTMAGRAPTGILSDGSTLDTRVAVRSALKAGLLGIFIGIIPLLGIVLTGALAVYFYRRKKGWTLPAAFGARLGGSAGMVVFAVNALLVIPIIAFHAQQEFVDSIVEMAKKYGIDTTTPQFQSNIHSIFTPSGLATFLIFAALLSAFGGAMAAVFFRSGNSGR